MAYSNDQIQGFYQKYLGRGYNDPNEGQGWLNDPNAEQNIKNSAEGQAFAQRATTPTGETNKGVQAPAIGAGVPGPAKPASTADQWGNAAGSQQAGIDAFWNAVTNNKQTTFDPAQLQAWGVTQLSPDKYRLATGQIVDTIGDVGGANTAGQWHITGGQVGQNGQVDFGAPGGGGAPGGAGGAGGAGSAMSSLSASSSNPQDMALRQQLIDQLTKRAGQTLDINSATDPNIRQQADPYAAQQERQRRQYLAQLAESQGPNANLTGEARLTAEQTGQANGGFEAALVGKEIDARRTEIQNALTSMQGMLSLDQQQKLQAELAQLNDATQRYGIQTQANTAASGQNLDWQKALLGNNVALGQLGLAGEQQYNYWDALNRGLING